MFRDSAYYARQEAEEETGDAYNDSEQRNLFKPTQSAFRKKPVR